jgi:hypothetical protein
MKKYRVTVFTTAMFEFVTNAESPQEAAKIAEKGADPHTATLESDDGPFESFIVDPIDASGKVLHDDPEYDTRILTPEFRRERASGKLLEACKNLVQACELTDDAYYDAIDTAVNIARDTIAEVEGSGS